MKTPMTPAILPCAVESQLDGYCLKHSGLAEVCANCPNRTPSREAELRASLRPIRQRAQDIGAYEIVNMLDQALGKVGV